ncbi:zinc finger protein ZFP2-like, partial [Engraulis encrasicolus]|uniref:zinc finger protein ZFP2-like n=1 Tax=Engraulis encrasicolus TaxID=184585 RepID=UPI002FCF7BFB
PTDRDWKTTTTTTHQPSSATTHQPSSATTHQPSSATPHQNDVPEQPRRLSARKSKSVYRRLMVLEKPKLKTEDVPLADDHRAPTKSQAATKPHGVTVESSSQQPSASQSHKSISEQLSSSSQSEKKSAPAHDEKSSQPSSSVPENKCEVCGLVVSSAVALRQHWRVHRSEMDCVCHKCGKICPNERSLTCHLLRHTYGERKKRRERAEKAASQKTEQVFVKTEKTTGTAGLLAAAPVQNTCQEQARRLSERMSKSEYRHRVISHTSQPPAALSVQTAHCTNTTTTTTTSLTATSPHKAAPSPAEQQQQQQQQPQPGQYPCQVCDEVFSSMASLEQHQEIHRDTAHPCGWCGRLFPSEEAMTSHARIHAEKKRYQCDRCDKSFPYRYSLTRHLVRHGLARSHAAATAATAAITVTIGATSAASLKPYPCSICGKRLSNKSSHRVHMRLHMRGGAAAEKPHKCSVCSQPFQHLKSLVVHMKKHEGEKPYGCLTCGKRFLYANSLTLHQRIHTGEMPYQCTVCGKRFRQAGNLNFHVKQHHSVHTLVLTAGIAQRK